jgi:DNA replication protein DnaC
MSRMEGVSSVIPRKYRGVSFDRAPVPDLDQTVVREVRRFVHEIDQRLGKGQGLWFMGDVGTGKTTLAMLVSKAALDHGYSVAIYSVPQLLAEIRDTYDADPGERSYMDFFRRLVAVDLLHLEDLGAEKRSDWVLEQLYSLVNVRYEEERSILVTTNLGLEELERQIGPRTVSRLVEICGDPLPLYGADQRIAYDPARSALG